MAYNSIELITKYSTKAWDKVYKAEAISSLLDAPESQVQFTGAKTVKIAKFSASGLGNYYRNNDGDERASYASPFGYAAGNVGLTWQEFTLKQDRSAKYPIELFDNEETDGLALGAATTEISRTIMIPEVDAYCFSEIAEYAGHKIQTAIQPGTNEFQILNEALLYLEEHEVPAEKQIILASPKFMNGLRMNNEMSRVLLQADYNKDVKFTLTSYEGRKIATVPPQRFRTKIAKTADGRIAGNGVHWAADSEFIDFMVFPTDAVLHVVKYNKVKIISGDMNLAGQGFDGYSIFARIYHDVFVTDNKRPAIVIHTTANYTPTTSDLIKLTIETGKPIEANAAEKLFRIYKTTRQTAPTVGSDFTKTNDDTLVKVGATAEASTTYVLVIDGKVAKVETTAAASSGN